MNIRNYWIQEDLMQNKIYNKLQELASSGTLTLTTIQRNKKEINSN